MTMKLTKYFYIASLIVAAQVVSSCDDFLELEPRGTQLEENFYRNQDELFQGLVAVYDVLQWGTSGGYTMKMPLLTAASDEAHAGGSDASDQPSWVAWDSFTLDPYLGPQAGLWQKNYTGVYRANLLLEKIGEVEGLDEAFKTRIIAEAKALRAYFYFDLIRFFGNIPLITGPIPTEELYSQPQATPAAVYEQIERDLNEARPGLPDKTNFTMDVSEKGRLTRSAATAL